MSSNVELCARRYAEALFGLGQSAGKLQVFQSNADDFAGILERSKDLKVSLSHPNIRREQRLQIVNELLAQCSYDEMFSNFVRLVVERGRIGIFPRIAHEFMLLRDDADGRLRGVVYSATALSSAQRQRLQERVQSKLGHEVVLKERIDASLIGGIRLEVDGRVYDGSVRHYLEQMKSALINGARV